MVCCGACKGCAVRFAWTDGDLEDDGDGGRAEKDMEPPPDPPADEGQRCDASRGVGGAWAICAIPPVRSTLSSVVGFVLAVMLLNVRGSER